MKKKRTVHGPVRKTIHAGFILLVVLIVPRAFGGFVATVNVGAAIPSLEVGDVEETGDSGFDIGGSIGFRLSDVVQWDAVELHYMSADQNDSFGSYEASNLVLGTGFRVGMFSHSSRLHPYVSFGVGGSQVTIEGSGLYARQWGFEWNVGAGLLLNVTEQTALGFRYRYRRTSTDDLLGLSILDNVNVNIQTMGIEFAFGK